MAKVQDTGPVSIVLPTGLKARVLVSERIRDLDEAEQLTRAEEWQPAQAWATWKGLQAGDRRKVSKTRIAADFDRVLRRPRRSRDV